MLEERQRSTARLVALTAEQEQAERGPAIIPVPAGPSPFAQGTWSQIAGKGIVDGWPSQFSKTKALAVHRDELYVGASDPNRAPAQIWRYDEKRWERIDPGPGHRGWAALSYVSALASDGTTLYAAVDDTVWAYGPDGEWKQIGGEGLAGSWQRSRPLRAYSMALREGVLYVGLDGGGAVVYAYADGRWTRVSPPGSEMADPRYEGVYELWTHTDGALYAGLIANPGPTAVFRYDGTRWEKVGGDGVNGSWRFPGFYYLLSFASLDGVLVVSMNRNPMVQGNFSSIWAFDGRSWKPVGLNRIPSAWAEMHNYNAVANFRGRLVIAAGGVPAYNTSVWELGTDGKLAPVGGRGIQGSWRDNARAAASVFESRNAEYIYRFVVWRDSLVAGFGSDPGSAKVWRYRPSR